MAAISISARDQFGESQYLSKYSNQLVELMRPVALQANKELYSDTYQAIAAQAQALVSSGELDESEVQNYVNDAFNLYMNPTKALQSGSVSDKMSTIKAIQNGGIDDPTAYLSGIVDTARYADQVSGGSTIAKGAIENAWGTRSFRLRNTGKASDTDKKQEAYQNKTADQLENIYKNQVKNADDFNTTSDQWSKWFENATAWIGDIKTAIGDKLWNIGEVIVGGIITYFGGKFLLHLAGSALGKAISGTASAVGGTTAVSGGSSALGILGTIVGGVTLGIGAANVIKAGIEKAFKEEDEKNVTAETSALEGTALEGNKAAEILGGMATTDQKENNNFGSQFGSAWNTTTRWLGVGTFGWTRDTAQINRDDFSYFREKIRMLGGGPTKAGAKDALLTWTLLLASADRLGDIDELKDITKSDLKGMVEASGVSPSSWDKYLDETVRGIGYLPNKNEKEDQTYIDWNKLGIEYHRYGLDDVPYDNYLASLHEGEAVLTTSTANELRNLLNEYRANNASMANLDTIIQQQTADLCIKLDEVIDNISNLQIGGYISSSTIDQTTARQLLKNSMVHMRSTKDALN